MGKSLAQDMGLQKDDLIYLTFRAQQGMYTSIEMLITGIVNSANPQVNNSMVFMNLDEAQKQLNTKQVTDITVKTDAFFKVKEYEPQIKAAAPNIQVYSWKKLSEDFTAMMTMKRKFQGIFLLMIMVIAVVGIVNTMLMSVYEKKAEIGTMKALGFTDQEVSNLFLFEGFLIGLAGGLMGLILGTLFNSWFYFVGMDITAMMGDQDIGMPIMGVVRSAWIADAYIKALLFATLASIVASYYPAKKVTKMEAMECLRTVQ
jgi:putative ABC transport system permease protein